MADANLRFSLFSFPVSQNTAAAHISSNPIGAGAQFAKSTTNRLRVGGHSMCESIGFEPTIDADCRFAIGSGETAKLFAISDALSSDTAVGTGKYRSL